LRTLRSDPFGDRFDAWVTSLETRTHGVTASDYALVVLALRKHYPERDLWELTTSELESFVGRPRTYRKRRPAKNTMKREQVVLRSFYGWCAKRYSAPDPAAELVVMRIPRPLPKPVDPRWIERALAAERNPRWKVVVLLAADAGLRRHEIANLRWADVELPKGEGWLAINGKGGKERAVPFAGRLFRALSTLERRGAYVITNRWHEQIHPVSLLRVVILMFERVGLEGVTVHRLRHTAGTQWFRAGGDARTVQELMGHESLATTMVYAEVASTSKMALVRARER